MKIVLNTKSGGQGIPDAIMQYALMQEHTPRSSVSIDDIGRTRPSLIEVVEVLEKSSGDCGLHVVEIPDDVDWEIEELGGSEWVSEKHRRWR